MSLVINNTRNLIAPDKFRLKILLYADPGFGKTLLASSSLKPIVAACETGHMMGLLSAASYAVDYVTPDTYQEFEQFCSGLVPTQKEHDTYVVDSLTTMTKRFIKDYVLNNVSRKQG